MSETKADDNREQKPMKIELRKLDRIETTGGCDGESG
jgi:hypothetical protein